MNKINKKLIKPPKSKYVKVGLLPHIPAKDRPAIKTYRGGTFHPAIKGHAPPPNCFHPKGQKNFKAYLKEIAKWNAPNKIMAVLKDHFGEVPQMTIEQAEALRVHQIAMEGKEWAYNRLHGKPEESIDITTQGEKITRPQVSTLSPETSALVNKLFDGEKPI